MDKIFTLPEAFAGQIVNIREGFSTVTGTFSCIEGVTPENETEKDYEYQVRLGLKLADFAEKSGNSTVTGDMVQAISEGIISLTDLLYMVTRGWKMSLEGGFALRMKGRIDGLEGEELVRSVVNMLTKEDR